MNSVATCRCTSFSKAAVILPGFTPFLREAGTLSAGKPCPCPFAGSLPAEFP